MSLSEVIGCTRLEIFDKSGQRKIILDGDCVGHPLIEICDSNQFGRLQFGVGKDGNGYIAVLDELARCLIGIGTDGLGRIGVDVFDKQGRHAFSARVDADGRRSLQVFDADGQSMT